MKPRYLHAPKKANKDKNQTKENIEKQAFVTIEDTAVLGQLLAEVMA